jgi:hypothetical protein
MVETGVRVALPDGYVGFVNPRSGLAARHGLSIVNAPGSIVEILDRLKDSLHYRDDDELGDPGTSIKMYWLPPCLTVMSVSSIPGRA